MQLFEYFFSSNPDKISCNVLVVHTPSTSTMKKILTELSSVRVTLSKVEDFCVERSTAIECNLTRRVTQWLRAANEYYILLSDAAEQRRQVWAPALRVLPQPYTPNKYWVT